MVYFFFYLDGTNWKKRFDSSLDRGRNECVKPSTLVRLTRCKIVNGPLAFAGEVSLPIVAV